MAIYLEVEIKIKWKQWIDKSRGNRSTTARLGSERAVPSTNGESNDSSKRWYWGERKIDESKNKSRNKTARSWKLT